MHAGHLSKANQFLTAAELIASSIEDSDLADAFVTLCVHAGMKNHAGYSAVPSTVKYQESARAAAQTLVEVAKLA
jgi:hypothetical protein